MAWIESHDTLARHPKTKRFARLLGISVPQAIGHLHLLWWWSLEYAQSGDLTAFESYELADAAMWEGEADCFMDAITRAGFLDVTDGAVLIHDWEEYAGKLLQRREANRVKQDAYRNRHKPQPPPPPDGNGLDMLPSRDGDVTVTSPSRNGATVPYRTEPNLTSNTHTRAREADSFDAIPAAAGSIHSQNEAAAQFAVFWETYPRRRNIQTVPEQVAFAAFITVVPRADWEACLTGVVNYAASSEVQRGIVKNADKWLINHEYDLWQQPETPPEQKGTRNGSHYQTADERKAASYAEWAALIRAGQADDGPDDERRQGLRLIG